MARTSPGETASGISTKFVPVIEFVRKYLDRVVSSSDTFSDHGQNKLTYEVWLLPRSDDVA